MKNVILLSDEHELPRRALLDALQAVGVGLTTITIKDVADKLQTVGGDLSGNALPSPPSLLAVLCEVAPGAAVAELHAAVTEAGQAWRGTPLIACRRVVLFDSGDLADGTIDSSALKRLGFHAVADEVAQLPALLRELEEDGLAGELRLPPTALEIVPAKVLLPVELELAHLRTAFEVVASLHFATDQKSAAVTALVGLASLVNADHWTIYLTGEVNQHSGNRIFETLAARSLTASERHLREGDGRPALRGEALTLPGIESRTAQEAVANARTMSRKEGAYDIIAVPLVSAERVLGVLEGMREGAGTHPFSVSEAALLSALALPLTAALANSARISEAERLSLTDDLTKLHNARFLRQYIINDVKRARRYNSSVAAIFLDLDDFKRVNDQYGHLVGSHVLLEMAAVILACVRDTDIVARYGGDEFVIILPETGEEQSAFVANRIRERIFRQEFTGGRSLRLALSASFGVAIFPKHAQSPQQLIACADTAMYQAKAAGKNCICFAPDDVLE